MFALRGRSFGVLGWRSFTALSRGWRIASSIATGNGSAFAGAILLDSKRLEHGLGLFSSRVDGEDHALSAMALLTAVEPCNFVLAASQYRSK